MKKYIKIMRLDHWIKQLFIIPGVVAAYALVEPNINGVLLINLVVGFLSTCFIASSNYIINEWLDAEFDKYHPIKKNRSVVENDLKPTIVYMLYIAFCAVGLILAYFVSWYLVAVELWLWIMGVLYNVKPIRTKDVAFIDVLTESINNAIRLLIGWFIVTTIALPPISLVIGYWFAGAFLMATKRFSEFRMIADKKLAGQYRKSFKFYSEKSLLLSAFFYAMCSNLFVGIFLIKYRVELILIMPFLIGLYCYYFWISFKEDSAAQKPEKLFKEKGLMTYVVALIIIFIVLMLLNIPFLNHFTSGELIKL